MDICVFHALLVYAVAHDAIDLPFSTVFTNFTADATHMRTDLENFALIVLHDAAQDIKMGHSYGKLGAIVARYYSC